MATESGKDRVITETTTSSVFIAWRSNPETGDDELLLVQQDGGWGPPAGGAQWIPEENRLETDSEIAIRELREEVGLSVQKSDIKLKGTASFQDPNNPYRYRRGIYYITKINYSQAPLTPVDPEIKSARFFEEKELKALMQRGEIYKPYFNIGLIWWWIYAFPRWHPGKSLPPDICYETINYYNNSWLEGSLR